MPTCYKLLSISTFSFQNETHTQFVLARYGNCLRRVNAVTFNLVPVPHTPVHVNILLENWKAERAERTSDNLTRLLTLTCHLVARMCRFVAQQGQMAWLTPRLVHSAARSLEARCHLYERLHSAHDVIRRIHKDYF